MNTELIRQSLRLIGLVLVATGWLPDGASAVFEHPETVAFVAGVLSYAIAEAGWIISKIKGRA